MTSPMQLDIRTILLLRHPDRQRWLLLRRDPGKKLFPNLITGIGGRVEIERGEGADLEQAALRELAEETRITAQEITRPRLRLSTLLTRDEQQVLLLWFTAELLNELADLTCTEGRLEFFPIDNLPFDQMIPTARNAIAFVTQLNDDDATIYNGIYKQPTMRLLVNSVQ